MLPPGREVECGCELALQRPVGFDSTGRNLRVTACLACGTVSVTESIAEEPRPHDVRCVGNVPLALPDPARAWLAGFPRVASGSHLPGSLVLLSPAARCANAGELTALERAELELQSTLTLRERFLRAGLPRVPAPRELPPELRHFGEAWDGVQLDESTSFDELVAAMGQGWASAFARVLLARRPRFEAEVAELLSSSDEQRRVVGARLIADERPTSPAILGALAAMLDGAPHSSDVQAALHAASNLREGARGLAPALLALGERIGDSDYYLLKRVTGLAERCR
ncbi:MAG: hypothetical protein KJ015_21075 [Myxococcales bacterium]|nr:hypothetical protein [Myxococcales bacterium]